MKFEITFDPDFPEFRRRLEQQVKDVANEAIERFGHGLQAACDEVIAVREGKTSEQLFQELRANIDRRQLPVTLADDNVRHYADLIAAGKHINVRLPDKL